MYIANSLSIARKINKAVPIIAHGISANACTVLSTSTDAHTFFAGLPQKINRRAFAISPPIVATGKIVFMALPIHNDKNNSLKEGIIFFGNK